MSRSTRFHAHVSSALPWCAVVLLALAASAAACAGELYQWKDAKGVTHYSDSPPPNEAGYKSRTIRDSGNASAEPGQATKPAESAQCTTARMNLEHLKGDTAVGFDANGDGKPDATFTAEQRAAQTGLAETAVKVNCTPTTVAGQG